MDANNRPKKNKKVRRITGEGMSPQELMRKWDEENNYNPVFINKGCLKKRKRKR